MQNLNKEQTEAVTHKTGPLLIVAGAGTGKTTVITRRVAYLIEQKLARPDEILALTFTDKAASEMQERLDLLLPLGYYDTWISTFHSFGERLLKNHGLDIGLPNNFELLDTTAQWVLIHNNFEKFNLDYYRPLGNPDKFIYALVSHFSKCKDELITPEDYLNLAQNLRLKTDAPHKAQKKEEAEETDETEIARIEEVANAYHIYQKLLLDNAKLDFGDLINYSLKLFKTRPQILNHYQKKFKYIMVDEFQDTNYAQYQLIKLLAGSQKNLTVVGDDDQSIYKFRGASVSNILKFKDDFPDLKEITLVENYRSAKEILDLSYKFIQQNNPDRLEIKLKINKELRPNFKNNGHIEVIEAPDLNSELLAIAKKILEIKTKDNTWNDFAILIRSNGAAEALLPVLAQAGIPHAFLANSGLYKKPIIVDLLAYLNLLNNTEDSLSAYRALNLPALNLSAQDTAAVLEFSHKKTISFFEAMRQNESSPEISETGRENLRLINSLINRHHGLSKTKTAAEMFVEIARDLKLDEKLKENNSQSAEDRELVEHFYKKIESFEEKHSDKSLHSFLEVLHLEQEAGDEGKIAFNPDLGPESVKILTVHSAKGLEFETVFLINLADKRFPSVGKKDPIEIPKELIKDILPEGDFHLQEERRLFYVGLTRAKKNLFLTWARDYGGKQAKKPSVFLVESGVIPSEKLTRPTGKVLFNKPLSKKPEAYTKLPEKFSYSQLKDFETCPLKYKYQYYLKLPVRGSQYLSFGNTIHKALELYLKQIKQQGENLQTDLFGAPPKEPELPEFQVLEQLYEKNWIDEWYPSKAEKQKYFAAGKEMLKCFYEESQKNKPKPKYIEQSFKLFLENYQLVGRIDRADSVSGGLIIYDYKTGKTPKKSEKKDIDQLYIYQWAAEEFLKEKVSGLKYWYLRENKFIEEPLANSVGIEDLKGELLELIKRVINTIKFDLFKEEHEKAKVHECQFDDLE